MSPQLHMLVCCLFLQLPIRQVFHFTWTCLSPSSVFKEDTSPDCLTSLQVSHRVWTNKRRGRGHKVAASDLRPPVVSQRGDGDGDTLDLSVSGVNVWRIKNEEEEEKDEEEETVSAGL